MNTYSKRMAYTYAALGLLWVSPFLYLLIKKYLPDVVFRFISEQEALLMGIYIGLGGCIFLFGKAWAYFGQSKFVNKLNLESNDPC